MARTLLLIMAFGFLAARLLPAVDAVDLEWRPAVRSGGTDGTMGQCGLDEFELDTEINRRIIAATRYISYGVLNRNAIPCSRRGASYYNCRPGAAMHRLGSPVYHDDSHYRRGCTALSRCQS